MIKKSFLDVFYESVEILKNNFTLFFPLLLIGALVSSFSLLSTNSTSNAIIITNALIEVFVGTIVTVFSLNIYFSKINNIKFSISKTLWDIPTFVFYELGFGLLFGLGVILLVIPGIIIFFLFAFVPTFSILFDYTDEGIYKKTKNTLAKNYKTYSALIFVSILVGLTSLASSQIVSFFGGNIIIAAVIGILLSLFSILVWGMNVSFISGLLRDEINQYYRPEQTGIEL